MQGCRLRKLLLLEKLFQNKGCFCGTVEDQEGQNWGEVLVLRWDCLRRLSGRGPRVSIHLLRDGAAIRFSKLKRLSDVRSPSV